MRKIIKKIFTLFGYKLQKNRPKATIPAKKNISFDWLKNQAYKTIIDIGANEGQFAKKMRSILPDASIISFEPITSVYSQLEEVFKNDRNFKAYNVGLGDTNQEMTIFLNEYSPSSSLLKMADLHKENFDFAKSVTETKVVIKLLDDLINSDTLQKPYLIKIDVQGYEDKVLKGGQRVISMADTILIEVSFFEFYEGQSLFDETYEKLKNMGFDYRGNFEQLTSPIDGRILQADAIFQKRKISD